MAPLKVALTKGQVIAVVILLLIWVTVPNLNFHHQAAPADDKRYPTETATESPKRLPLVNIHPPGIDEDEVFEAPSDQTLTIAQAEKFCLRYHLEPYNASAAIKDQIHAQVAAPPKRRIYDLLLITATTSADMLELRLASMYQHVDYIVMLEAPSLPSTKEEAADASPDALPLSGKPADGPSLLDKIWTSHLSSYQSKIIRHSLSQHSHDFKTGLDHAATTRNALYTRVIPLLTGVEKVQPGDVLLVSDVEELVRPVTMKVLRNCHIPERTTIRTRKYWYSFQWMKVDRPGATPDAAAAAAAAKVPESPDGAGKAKANQTTDNEWWPHPQATVYQGADTILPDDLRKDRGQDQYVFGDGGWTCHLCYSTITETLAKIGEMGVVWHEGPRWKGAGRVVDRVGNGVDVYDRTNLSRIDANVDVPRHLQTHSHRYGWMLDRDATGAGFSDFDAADHERFLGSKKEVDAQPDFETTRPDLSFNRANTDIDDVPLPPASWRSDEPAKAEGGDKEAESEKAA